MPDLLSSIWTGKQMLLLLLRILISIHFSLRSSCYSWFQLSHLRSSERHLIWLRVILSSLIHSILLILIPIEAPILLLLQIMLQILITISRTVQIWIFKEWESCINLVICRFRPCTKFRFHIFVIVIDWALAAVLGSSEEGAGLILRLCAGLLQSDISLPRDWISRVWFYDIYSYI